MALDSAMFLVPGDVVEIPSLRFHMGNGLCDVILFDLFFWCFLYLFNHFFHSGLRQSEAKDIRATKAGILKSIDSKIWVENAQRRVLIFVKKKMHVVSATGGG